MSFNLQPVNQPLIQNSQRMQNNGGGGNLGYMQQGKNKKDEEKDRDDNTNLLEQDAPDILQLDFDDGIKKKSSPKKTNEVNWLDNIVNKISQKMTKKDANPFRNVTT